MLFDLKLWIFLRNKCNTNRLKNWFDCSNKQKIGQDSNIKEKDKIKQRDIITEKTLRDEQTLEQTNPTPEQL